MKKCPEKMTDSRITKPIFNKITFVSTITGSYCTA